jgi:methionyl-tRNA formyltransferase
MKKVYFAVNDTTEITFNDHCARHLSGFEWIAGEGLPPVCEAYAIIVLWNYKKMIREIPSHNNILVFHSTDLPDGKGWAPIYNTIVRRKEYYTITGILINEETDGGDIIAKARFAMKPNYTADILRQWDHEITIMAVAQILKRMTANYLKGEPQTGASTYYPRRNTKDNEVFCTQPLNEIIDHLRACEKNHPAFIDYQGQKYTIKVEPVIKPAFPEDLEMQFYGNIK